MNEKKLVYVVMIDRGQYDDNVQFIDSIFSDLSNAQDRQAKITTEMEYAKSSPCPVGDNSDFDKMTDEELDLYNVWSQDYYDANEFNCCYIAEFELDKKA